MKNLLYFNSNSLIFNFKSLIVKGNNLFNLFLNFSSFFKILNEFLFNNLEGSFIDKSNKILSDFNSFKFEINFNNGFISSISFLNFKI